MKVKRPFKISGTGIFTPGNAISSSDLEMQYGIPKGWISKHSGVETRYHATGINAGEMGARAVESALHDASLNPGEIDLLISASASFDHIIPNQAIVIKSFLQQGEEYDFPVLSINSVCTGFISALDIASYYLQTPEYDHIVIVNAEISSRFLDPENWETATLFGDAASAVIVSKSEKQNQGIIKTKSYTYSEGADYTIIEGGGNKYPIKDHAYDPKLHSFSMQGFPLLKLAKKHIPEFMHKFFSEFGMTIEDIDHILPHQASRSGLAVFKNLYSFKDNQVKENLKRFGNCISASIPLLLHELWQSRNYEYGDLCFLSGTGAGFSIAGTLVKL